MRPIGPIIELVSPAGRVRIEVAVESVWIGATVYPECPVWRAWYDGRPVVATSTLGLHPPAEAPRAYAMTFLRMTRQPVQTGIGPGLEAKAIFAGRDGRELELHIRATDRSAFCSVRCPEETLPSTHSVPDLSITRFPEGSARLGEAAPDGKEPQVWFVPSGKLVAFWRHGAEQHIVFFDRPGDLAVRRFGALKDIGALSVSNGRQGCEHLFLTVPFTKAALPAPVFGEALTPAFRAAFEMMLGRDGKSDDFWMLRGEPGVFAVAARRQGRVWHVGGVTAAAQTLTVRFEDLWLRMPVELRALSYTVKIVRDPLKNEVGNPIEETFADQAPDVRVALDLAKDGGFLLRFEPLVFSVAANLQES